MHARRNLAKWITPSHLKKISALFGDGVHDLDLMLWYSGAKPKSVYAQSLNTRPELPNDDLGWAMFRLDSGAIAVIENVWCLPENAPFAIDARMEIIGTKGAIYIDNSGHRLHGAQEGRAVLSPVHLLAQGARPAPRLPQGGAGLLHPLHR